MIIYFLIYYTHKFFTPNTRQRAKNQIWAKLFFTTQHVPTFTNRLHAIHRTIRRFSSESATQTTTERVCPQPLPPTPVWCPRTDSTQPISAMERERLPFFTTHPLSARTTNFPPLKQDTHNSVIEFNPCSGGDCLLPNNDNYHRKRVARVSPGRWCTCIS